MSSCGGALGAGGGCVEEAGSDAADGREPSAVSAAGGEVLVLLASLLEHHVRVGAEHSHVMAARALCRVDALLVVACIRTLLTHHSSGCAVSLVGHDPSPDL